VATVCLISGRDKSTKAVLKHNKHTVINNAIVFLHTCIDASQRAGFGCLTTLYEKMVNTNLAKERSFMI